MSQAFFDVEKGYQLDGTTVRLTGSGIPGATTDTDAAVVGSFYTDEADGGFFVKVTAGSGTDKWAELATQTYADNTGGGVDWKDSVRVATTAALPAYTQAGSGVGATLTANAVGVLTIDGENVLLGDRVLVKDEAGAPGDADHGIYECTTEGTAGVAFVLTRATDADEDAEVTANMAVGVEEGTANADSYWALTTNDPIVVDTTQLNFVEIANATTQAELGFIRDFIGKTGPGVESPTYSSTNYVSGNLENAIGQLDAQLGTTQGDLDTLEASFLDSYTVTSQTNVTTATVIDSVDVNAVAAVKWKVHAEGNLLADANEKRAVEIWAIHDGHNNGAGADAVDTDFTIYAKLKMGSITGLQADVTLSGSGASQVMRLEVTSTTAVDVRAIREVINF